jgi:hypothetical protein
MAIASRFLASCRELIHFDRTSARNLPLHLLDFKPRDQLMSKPSKLFSRNHFPALSFFFLATLLAGSIIVAAKLKVRHDETDVNHAGGPAVPGQRRVQMVRFTLYDAGIYPQEIRASPGRLTISLEDLTRSSSGVIVRRVEENARVPAGVANKAPNALRSRTELNLPAGLYEVADASRPDNQALLIVED